MGLYNIYLGKRMFVEYFGVCFYVVIYKIVMIFNFKGIYWFLIDLIRVISFVNWWLSYYWFWYSFEDF